MVSGEDETGGFGRPGLAIVGGGVDAVAGVDSGGGGVDGVGGVVEAEVEGGSVEGALPGRLVEDVGGDPDAAVGVVVEAAADGSEDVAVGELEDVLDGVVGREAGHLPGDAGVGRDGEASEVAGVSDVPLEAHLRGGRSTTGSVDGVRVCGGDVEGGDGAAGDGLRVEDVDPERAFAGDGISGSPNTTVDSAEEEGVTDFDDIIRCRRRDWCAWALNFFCSSRTHEVPTSVSKNNTSSLLMMNEEGNKKKNPKDCNGTSKDFHNFQRMLTKF